jgi:hypothetical protein
MTESHHEESEDPDDRPKRTRETALDLVLDLAPVMLDLASALVQQDQGGAPTSVLLLGALATAVRVVASRR